jgi:aspartyl-tRNA(Asn)/glutamyl-tRNA(Gln) amidotransferase subunit B
MHLEPVIGLEIHIQLKTKSKMFCGCPANDAAVVPNANVCPVCMGHPGTLPVPNETAVRFAVLMGLALNCAIASASKFDRKHYFYPDLPKGYQISQYDVPIASDGRMEVETPGGKRDRAMIGIVRVHLEEDAAKSFHDTGGKTFVDFNRAGVPLIETVTAPDFRSPLEAKVFLQELQRIARYLGISDADMEKGQLRCDANISLREVGADGVPVSPTLHPKTEVKNMNSFKAVERALEYEILRQKKFWEETGGPPQESTTRGWSDTKQVTEPQRSKEEADDYRYFPEPDIPPLLLSEMAEEMRARLPELPAARRERFMREYLLSAEEARQLTEDMALADYAERVFSEVHAWLQALPELDGAEEATWEKEKKRVAKLVGGWLLSKLGGLVKERGMDWDALIGPGGKIDAENFAEFVTLLATNKLSTANGLLVLAQMLETGIDPSHVMEERQLGLMTDETEVAEVVSRVLEAHPKEVERYRAGDKQLYQFFIGQIMKETEGRADPKLVKNMLSVKLEE